MRFDKIKYICPRNLTMSLARLEHTTSKLMCHSHATTSGHLFVLCCTAATKVEIRTPHRIRDHCSFTNNTLNQYKYFIFFYIISALGINNPKSELHKWVTIICQFCRFCHWVFFRHIQSLWFEMVIFSQWTFFHHIRSLLFKMVTDSVQFWQTSMTMCVILENHSDRLCNKIGLDS